MSSAHKNLNQHTAIKEIQAQYRKIGIVTSEWNTEITEALYTGAFEALTENGILPKNIFSYTVPGSYELVLAAKWMAAEGYRENAHSLLYPVDAVLCLGCVIQGETPHFTFICQAVANGLIEVGLQTGKPVVFGVLTTITFEQAKERAGGKLGNKGYEAGITALKMLGVRGNFTPASI